MDKTTIKEKIIALKKFILKLEPIIFDKSFSFFSNSDVYLIIPFSIPNELIVLPSLRKSFNCPIKNIPFVPSKTATIFVEINLAIRLIAVLNPERKDVFIKFII